MIRFDLRVVFATLVLGACARNTVPVPTSAQVFDPGPFRLEMLSAGTTVSLRGLSVVDDRVVWASGTEGTVLRTLDGGVRWNIHRIVGPTRLDIRDLHAFSADEAIAVATAGRVFRTTDGGATWHTVYESADTSVFLDAVSFWDEAHGIVLGDPRSDQPATALEPSTVIGGSMAGRLGSDAPGRFLILLTEDGGATWKEPRRLATPLAEPGEAAFAASGTALAVAGSKHGWIGTGGASVSRLFRTDDRGRTWSVSRTPIQAGSSSAGVFSVFFSDTLNGLIAGGDYKRPATATVNLAFTRDGGQTFSQPAAFPAQYVSSIVWTKPGLTIMGAGIAGVVYSAADTIRWKVLDAQNWNSLATSENFVWAVGPEGRIARISTTR